MKNKKLITYVLTISENFPKTHSRSGDPTNFVQSISDLIKLHTIRGNYDLWENRFKKIESGEACLSIRVWEGKPYNSSQKEIFNLTNKDGIGIQKLESEEMILTSRDCIKTKDGRVFIPRVEMKNLATHDGLSLPDFKEWFKGYDLSEPMAIIHFSRFRY